MYTYFVMTMTIIKKRKTSCRKFNKKYKNKICDGFVKSLFISMRELLMYIADDIWHWLWRSKKKCRPLTFILTYYTKARPSHLNRHIYWIKALHISLCCLVPNIHCITDLDNWYAQLQKRPTIFPLLSSIWYYKIMPW